MHTLLRTVRQTAFAMSVLFYSAAFALDKNPDEVPSTLHDVENLSNLRQELKIVLTPEVGFPAEYVRKWASAVDAAFAPGLLKADFVTALERRLTDDARSAALAFDASPLGRETLQIITNLQSSRGNPDALARTRDRVASASAEDNAVFVDLFEVQFGPRRANEVLDVYFRAMETAAEPVIGAESAKQWTASAKHLRDGYVEDYFFTATMVFEQLPRDKRKKLAEALSSPPMVAYAEQSTDAFSETLQAAAARLEKAYAEEMKGE